MLKEQVHPHTFVNSYVYIRRDISIVPIMVGAIDKSAERTFGRTLAPFLTRDDTLCIVSSDFCHWYVYGSGLYEVLNVVNRGTRFSYTYYYPQSPTTEGEGIRLSRATAASKITTFAIHQSIEALDRQALDILTVPPSSATGAHDNFAQYLIKTKNTICGRHPIGVLFGALSALEEAGRMSVVKWVRYEQSSQCLTIDDSSVSYASAYVTF